MGMLVLTMLVVVGLAWLLLAPRADEGYGTTIVGGSSGSFFAEIQSVSLSGYERAAIETTHMTSTSGWRTFQPSDLKSPGTIELELSFRPNDNIPITSAAETWTITFPIPSGGSSGATLACSGFLTSFEFSDPMDERMTATATLQLTGPPTWVDAS